MTDTFSSKDVPSFAKIRFIMMNPSHPGNVGATARAIKTMGFYDLCLVAPKERAVATNPQAIAMASGATDILQSMHEVETLEHALASTTFAFALTARPRVIGPPVCDIREAASMASNHLKNTETARIAFVLGTERAGLSNDAIALCQRICHIPANPDYSSLNVAQAAQLVAWEMRYALATAASLPLIPHTEGAPDPGTHPASAQDVYGFLEHLETALKTIGFLGQPQHSRRMTYLRHLFGRCGLSHNETNMLHGICTAILNQVKK